MAVVQGRRCRSEARKAVRRQGELQVHEVRHRYAGRCAGHTNGQEGQALSSRGYGQRWWSRDPLPAPKDGVEPECTELLMGKEEPQCALSEMGKAESRRAELRKGGVGPRRKRSGTSTAGPERAALKREAALPSWPKDLRGTESPACE